MNIHFVLDEKKKILLETTCCRIPMTERTNDTVFISKSAFLFFMHSLSYRIATIERMNERTKKKKQTNLSTTFEFISKRDFLLLLLMVVFVFKLCVCLRWKRKIKINNVKMIIAGRTDRCASAFISAKGIKKK